MARNIKIESNEQLLNDIYLNTVSRICKLDEVILEKNSHVFDNVKYNERTVSYALAQYIFEHASTLLAILILDYKDGRNVYADALNTEFEYDASDSHNKLVMRTQMSHDIFKSEHYAEIGFTIFSSSVIQEFLSLMADNIKLFNTIYMKNNSDTFKAILSDEDNQLLFSVILSNYAYLLRAFMFNGVFLKKITTLVKSFEREYYQKG